MKRAACIAYEGSGRQASAPPCERLQEFLLVGDALYTSTYSYCHDCRRIWSYTHETYVTNDRYWELVPFAYLLNPSVWGGWIGTPAGPLDELQGGIAGLESWLKTLKTPHDATTPI